MKVKVPKTLQIASFRYTLGFAELNDNHHLLGQCRNDKQQMVFEPNLTQQTKDQALWHEVLHAIDTCYSCKLEEEEIDRTAQGITAVLKNDFGIEFDWEDIK